MTSLASCRRPTMEGAGGRTGGGYQPTPVEPQFLKLKFKLRAALG